MLKDCQAGGRFEGTVLITEWKETPFRQKPGSFLLLTCQDVSGLMSGKIWDPKPEYMEWLAEDDVYQVSAKVTEFKGALDLTIENLRPLPAKEIDWAQLLPCSPYSEAELEARLQKLRQKIQQPQLRELLDGILDHAELGAAFRQAPAAMRVHQPYLRGLWEHSVLVAEISCNIAALFPALDQDVLIAGALFHDLGKIYEYAYERSIAITTEGRLLGHIVMGVDLLSSQIAAIDDFPKELRVKLLHIIISHHGRYEWQSPRRPKSMEAVVVHYADAMEADLWQFSNAAAGNSGEEWSPYIKSLERYILLK